MINININLAETQFGETDNLKSTILKGNIDHIRNFEEIPISIHL